MHVQEPVHRILAGRINRLRRATGANGHWRNSLDLSLIDDDGHAGE